VIESWSASDSVASKPVEKESEKKVNLLHAFIAIRMVYLFPTDSSWSRELRLRVIAKWWFPFRITPDYSPFLLVFILTPHIWTWGRFLSIYFVIPVLRILFHRSESTQDIPFRVENHSQNVWIHPSGYDHRWSQQQVRSFWWIGDLDFSPVSFVPSLVECAFRYLVDGVTISSFWSLILGMEFESRSFERYTGSVSISVPPIWFSFFWN
jgi:hypothetical protein